MTEILKPSKKDLGGFVVRRVLPGSERKAVGPCVFFDHMGPASFEPGDGIQVRPHPHIGLATVTYLFEGEIVHRDSLGYVQPIKPGAVNLMTAGRGIVHSERAGDDLHEHSRLHGIQTWMALPEEEETCEPAFEHYPRSQIPQITVDRASVRVIMGQYGDKTSPVRTKSPTLYLECLMPAGSLLEIPGTWCELGAYVVSGSVKANGTTLTPYVMGVGERNSPLELLAEEHSVVMVLGGDPLGRRIVWWNLVASDRRLIEKAKLRWKLGQFDKIPGETEFIPLPED